MIITSNLNFVEITFDFLSSRHTDIAVVRTADTIGMLFRRASRFGNFSVYDDNTPDINYKIIYKWGVFGFAFHRKLGLCHIHTHTHLN